MDVRGQIVAGGAIGATGGVGLALLLKRGAGADRLVVVPPPAGAGGRSRGRWCFPGRRGATVRTAAATTARASGDPTARHPMVRARGLDAAKRRGGDARLGAANGAQCRGGLAPVYGRDRAWAALPPVGRSHPDAHRADVAGWGRGRGGDRRLRPRRRRSTGDPSLPQLPARPGRWAGSFAPRPGRDGCRGLRTPCDNRRP